MATTTISEGGSPVVRSRAVPRPAPVRPPGVAPALLPACCFALGIAFAARCWLTPAWLLPGVLLLGCMALVAAWRAPRLQPVALAPLFLLLGCLAAELQPPIDPQQQLAWLAADGRVHTVVGEVTRVEAAHRSTYNAFFQHTSRDESTQRFDLHLHQLLPPGSAPVALSGGLRFSIYTRAPGVLPAVRCGTRLQVSLPLRAESHYGDPGVWDAAEYMHAQGIGAIGSLEAANVRVLSYGAPTWACRLHSWQALASDRVIALAALPGAQHLPALLRISPEDASMLTAMLTGDRSYLQKSTRIGFERTGSFHLLVVSGMHLAIFSSVVLLVARRLRLPSVASTALTILLSFGYALFTGYGEPVQRSFWMVTLFLVGQLVFRERFALQALGLAALLLLAADPRALSGASLQMTLLTVVAIGGLCVPAAERTFQPYLRGTRELWLFAIDASMPSRVAQLRVMLRLLASHLQPVVGRTLARSAPVACLRLLLRALELLLVSVTVELVMALPMAIYFHRITVLGLPVNFLIVPLLGLLLPSAMLCFVTVLVWPSAAVVPAACTALLLHAVNGLVRLFSALPVGDYRLPGPPSMRIVAWVLVLAAAVWLVRRPAALELGAAFALLLAAALLAVAPQAVRHAAGTLEIATLDVGQGDAILVITPDGKTMLIDAGGLVGAAPGSSFDMGEEVVSPALWARGIRRLDAVAISHAHADHIGGMAAVLANFRPRILLVGNNPLSLNYAALLNEARQDGIAIETHRQGDRWTLGNQTSLEALWPSATYVPQREPSNNDSLVLRLVYRHTSALLEGDAQALAEHAMVQAGLPHTDLLKVGHHGSLSSSTPEFLAALSPSFGVISCGRRNFYGHPREGTLIKLQQAHVRTFRTDLIGETDFFLTGSEVQAEPWTLGQTLGHY